MTEENKQLLIKDLCARLSYGVKLHIEYYDLQGDEQLKERDIELTHGNISYCFGRSHWSDFKPYLRPMSSMTEKEISEFQKRLKIIQDVEQTLHFCNTVESIDWLNEHHFDYRGLIPMGLALEAPEGMYKTE